MQLRKRNLFTTVRTEGSILPADLLQRINDRDAQLKGLTPDDYHLAGGLKLNEAINQSWNRMQGAWAVFQSALEKLPPSDTGTTVTREKWLLPLFQELGYGRLPAAKAIEVEGKSYPISHLWQQTPIHLVSARVDLDTRTAGVAGASRVSPHGLTQELLNAAEAHLWGFVSNGLRLRILRNNVSLTRQAYVEFDLEAMMNGEQFPDFMMLWLLCHESRVNAEKPQDCWLERWSKAAHEQGTRALEQLRNGVEDAIKALGRGFLAHQANQTLLGSLRKGELDKQDYYRQLLRLVYRLLFLFVAEDRELLFAPEADEKTRERYARFYSVSRLRRLAERRLGARHGDLYHGLRVVMQKLGNGGCVELGLPALGSFLFSDEAIADLNGCELANHELLEAVRALAFITEGHRRRTVDYKNLRSEELGSVYEALLELHPEINAEARQFNLASASGNERKTTGSYYTPDSLVQCLLDSALDPVVAEALKQTDPEQAILSLKVCDPACGSGHFLIAAAHRLAKHLASVRTGDGEPAPEAVRTALRDVIGHSIYGVDINPMAVELCKVSLWMEAIEPGKPLSFLEHRIQCGNSLIGATPSLLKKGIPDEAFKPIEGDDKATCAEYRRYNKQFRESGQRNIFESEIKLGALAQSILSLEEVDDSTIEGVREKQRRWEELVRSNDYLYGGLLADAWCAAFVWKKLDDRNHPRPITEEIFRKIEQSPWHIARTQHEIEIKRLAAQFQFFHWHLAFPDVFRALAGGEEPENEQAGWSGGFDVALGNPPWDRLKHDETEWFATRAPEIAQAQTAALRKKLIEQLPESNPTLAHDFAQARRLFEGINLLVRDSQRFQYGASGELNLAILFAETGTTLTSRQGRLGMILPTTIVTDKSAQPLCRFWIKQNRMASVFDFENREKLFPAVDSRYKFCLLTLVGEGKKTESVDVAFFATQTSDLADDQQRLKLSLDDIRRLNPNTLSFPVIRTKKDVELLTHIHQQAEPLLLDHATDGGSWGYGVLFLFEMNKSSHLFQAAPEPGLAPLLEAKLIHQFNHRAATFDGQSARDRENGNAREMTETELKNPQISASPRYWLPQAAIDGAFERGKLRSHWAVVIREVTNATNERTVISCIIPRVGMGHTCWTVKLTKAGAALSLLFVTNLNSFALDYAARQKVGGMHMSNFILKQLPVIPPSSYTQLCRWLGFHTLREWLVPRVLELTYTAHDLRGFAEDCGYTGEPFRWDEDRRFLLRCELDAAYFHLYGIGREDVNYILDTFPIVRRKDEQAHGEYRTKRVILEIYDEMRLAMESGAVYQTRLDPPPANGWIPPELAQEEMVTKSAPQPAETSDGKQSDLFKWQAEDPQQQLKFDDID